MVSSCRLDPSHFVVPAVENSLELLRRALRSPRNSNRHLVLNRLNRKTPQPLGPHRQPAELLRTATRPTDVCNLDYDLVDAGTEPAQGKIDPPPNLPTHHVVDWTRAARNSDFHGCLSSSVDRGPTTCPDYLYGQLAV